MVINSKQAQDFEHRKLQFFNTLETVAHRPSIQFFYRLEAFNLQQSNVYFFFNLLFAYVFFAEKSNAMSLSFEIKYFIL